MDNIDHLAALALADRRLADSGYPRGEIRKGGSVELQAAFLAGDVVKRSMARCGDLVGKVEGLRTKLDATAAAIRSLQAADRANQLSALLARPRGNA